MLFEIGYCSRDLCFGLQNLCYMSVSFEDLAAFITGVNLCVSDDLFIVVKALRGY